MSPMICYEGITYKELFIKTVTGTFAPPDWEFETAKLGMKK